MSRYGIRKKTKLLFHLVIINWLNRNKRSQSTIDLEPLIGENLERYLLQQDKGTDTEELARGAGYGNTDEGLKLFIDAVYVASYVRGFADERQISYETAWKLFQAKVNARPSVPNPDTEQLVKRLRNSVKERLEKVSLQYSEQFKNYDCSPTVSVEDSNKINISWIGGGFYTVDRSGTVSVVRGGIEPLNFDDSYCLQFNITEKEGISMLADLVVNYILKYTSTKNP